MKVKPRVNKCENKIKDIDIPIFVLWDESDPTKGDEGSLEGVTNEFWPLPLTNLNNVRFWTHTQRPHKSKRENLLEECAHPSRRVPDTLRIYVVMELRHFLMVFLLFCLRSVSGTDWWKNTERQRERKSGIWQEKSLEALKVWMSPLIPNSK